MTLYINGEQHELSEGLTLSALITQLGMKADRVAVELNLEIVARATWDSVVLKSGDRLEIVHFVGGGSGSPAGQQLSEEDESLPGDENWECPSCLTACEANFCPSCGEKRPSRRDLSVVHLLSHASEILFHWDSKIFRTFRVLLTRPGLLSSEYVASKRKPYAHPFQVFFIANLLYFILHDVTGWSGLKTTLVIYEKMQSYSAWATRMAEHRAAVKGITMADLAVRFDHVMALQARSMVLVMVPLFAVALLIVEWRKKRYFGEHLVFALHFVAFWLMTAMLLIPTIESQIARVLIRHGVRVTNAGENEFLGYAIGLLLFCYLLPAVRRFYSDSLLFACIKSVLLVLAMGQILELYRLILFVTALYST